MMKAMIGCLALLLSGCAPFVEVGVGYQIDRWSDWVLQPERAWVNDEPLYTFSAGLEWKDHVDCPSIDIVSGAYEQAFLSCSKRFGGKFFSNVQLKHQINSRTSDFLQTDQKQWQGHNPFLHLRIGYDWGGVKCPQIATGKSLFQGAPFESETGNPDLYWTNLECSVRFFGQSGVGR